MFFDDLFDEMAFSSPPLVDTSGMTLARDAI